MSSSLIILIICFNILILCGIAYGIYITQKQLTNGWKEFAEEEGLYFSPGILPIKYPIITGNYKGYETSTSLTSDGSSENSDWIIVIKMAIHYKGILHLHIKNKSTCNINPLNLFKGLPLIEKKNEIETFENSFDVTCNHNEIAKKIISREIEEELMTRSSIDIRIVDNYIYYETISGYVDGRDKLKNIYELLWKMAENIS